jgi:hypothetical protein
MVTHSKRKAMKRYRLDPQKPRKLTPAEARRLDAMPIDYSDIPELGENFFKEPPAPEGRQGASETLARNYKTSYSR